MGEIKQVFTSDISKLENDLAKLQANYLKLKEEMGSTTRAGREGGQEVVSAARAGIQALAGQMASLLSVKGGVDALNSAYREYHENVKKAAEQQERLNKAQVAGQAKAGLLREGPAVEEALKQVRAGGATREQAQAALFGVGEAAPGLDMARRTAIAASVARLAPAGSTEDLQQLAQMAGRVAEVMPERSATQVASVTETLRSKLGASRAGELLSPGFMGGVKALVASGAAGPEEALALAAQAILKDMPAGVVQQLFAKVGEDYIPERLPHGVRPTQQQRLKREFGLATPQQRLGMMFERGDIRAAVAGERLGGRLSMLSADEVSAGLGDIQAALGRDVVAEELAGMRETATGRQVLEEQREALKADVSAERKAPAGLGWKGFDEAVAEKLKDASTAGGWYQRNIHVPGVKATAAIDEFLTSTGFGRWFFGREKQIQYTPEEVMGRMGMFSPQDIQKFRAEQAEITGQGAVVEAVDALGNKILTNQATNAAAAGAANQRE